MKVVQNGHVKYRIEVCGCWVVYTNDRHRPVMKGYCEEHDPERIPEVEEVAAALSPEPEPEPAPETESAEVEVEILEEVKAEDAAAVVAADIANAQPEGDEPLEPFDLLKPEYPTLVESDETEPEEPEAPIKERF